MGEKRGLIIVISAASGSGKTTLCNRLAALTPNLERSISMTTRSPRRGEKDGRDYIFVSPDEFERRRDRDEFIEWARVLDEYYGTPRGFVEQTITTGKDIILSIDVQGAMQVKKKYPDAIFIFVLPPSMEALEQRLRRRKTDNTEEISRRLQLAKEEMAQIENYDYVVVNRDLSSTLRELSAIITAEKRKVGRSKEEIDGLRSS